MTSAVTKDPAKPKMMAHISCFPTTNNRNNDNLVRYSSQRVRIVNGTSYTLLKDVKFSSHISSPGS